MMKKYLLLFLPLLMLFLLMPKEARAEVAVFYTTKPDQPNQGQFQIPYSNFAEYLRFNPDDSNDRGWFWYHYFSPTGVHHYQVDEHGDPIYDENHNPLYTNSIYYENITLDEILFYNTVTAADMSGLFTLMNNERNGRLPSQIPALPIWFNDNSTVSISGNLSADDMRSLFDCLQNRNLKNGTGITLDMSRVTSATLPKNLSTDDMRNLFYCLDNCNLSFNNVNMVDDTYAYVDGNLTSTQMGYLSAFIKQNHITLLDMRGATVPNNTIPSDFAGGWNGGNSNNLNLLALLLPTSTEIIEQDAFINAGPNALAYSNLRDLTNLTTIGIGAFRNTAIGYRSLNNDTGTWEAEGQLIIPASVTTVGNDAFRDCQQIQSVTLVNDRLTALSDGMFRECRNLVTAATGGVNSFGDDCFRDCVKLLAPNFNGATRIGNCSFYNCDAFDNPDFHYNHITYIGDEAFRYCDGLITLNFPKNQSFTTLNTGVCADCPNLEAVTIYNEVTKIDSQAFLNCGKLNDITFQDPSQITTIAPEAFKNCAAITNACDGLSHVQKLGWSAFEGCTNLSEQAIRSILTGFVSGYNDNSTNDADVTSGRIPSRAFKNCSNMPASPLGTAILPSTSWSGEQWKAYATAYTNYQHTTSFQYHDVVDENIKPSADANSNEWYALDYDITSNQAKQPYTNSGETSTYYYSWKELDGPFSNNGNNWGFKEEFVNESTNEGAPTDLGCGNLENHAADIFIRREFEYTGTKNGVIILTWGHDDSPCEYYLNGNKLPVQAGDGDFDGDGGMWWTHAIYTLTEEQKGWLKNDGTKNVLAFRVHQNWGGCQADCGLYIDTPDESSTMLGDDADVFGWQCVYTDSQPADKDGKTWKDVGYSEADWTAGFGSFGSTAIKPENIKTQWPENADRWVRRHFYLTANDIANKANDTWTLRYLLDDTMEMFLNGTLIKSVNNIYQTNPNDWQIVKLSTEQKNLLHEGDNVVAIKLHNASGSCFFDFALMKQDRDIDLSVNSNISVVGEEAFDGCNLISSINLGNVTTLEDRAFASADKVTKITVNTVDAPTVGSNALDSGIDPNHCQVVFVGLCDSLYTDYHNEQTFRRLLTKSLDEAAAYYDVVPQRHAIVNLKRKFTHGWNTLALPFGIKRANGQSAALYEKAICGEGYADNYATDKANDDAFSIAAYRGLRYNQTNPDNSVFTFLEINRSEKATDKVDDSELDEFEPLLIWVPQRVIDRQDDNTLYTFNDINLNFDDGGSHGKKLYQPYQLPGFVSSEGEPFWGLYDASATYFNGNDRTHYAFVGTFSTKTSDMHADAIRNGDAFIQNGQFFTATIPANATIPAKKYRMKGYRGWFRQIVPFESESTESKASTYDIDVFRSEGDDAPTRITTLDGERLHDVVPFDIYDMNGRKVRTDVTSTQGLAKGIYIANGKKIVIK